VEKVPVEGVICIALTGLGNFITGNPGRRSRTRFALGYHVTGFQPFEIGVCRNCRVENWQLRESKFFAALCGSLGTNYDFR
jgi:hypothetical protein